MVTWQCRFDAFPFVFNASIAGESFMSFNASTDSSSDDWQQARKQLLAREKQLTKLQDELAAERRRLPRVRVEKEYVFEGKGGTVSFEQLFKGRPQLLLYHFMFAPSVRGWPDAACPGCSMFMDSVGQFTRTHLANRDVSFAAVSLAPIENIERYRRRMNWDITWVSASNNSFNQDFGLTTPEGERHGISVFLRENDAIYWTYFTAA